MDLLIIGGGVFLGRAILDAALACGHRVTVFNRGRSRSTWPEGVEAIAGDRSGDLSQLAGRRWDAVVDTSGYVPNEVAASAERLRDCGRYLFVSTISAYATTSQVPITETDPTAALGAAPRDRKDMAFYGAQKAACESEVQKVFGDRAVIVRPGLIVGAGDPTGRFSHWPWRVAGGGTMLVPDPAGNVPLQFIDARDLGEWIVRLVEAGARGVFNGTGPARRSAIGWAELIATCESEVRARGIEPARGVRVSEEFLAEKSVEPWSELPLWLPSTDPEYVGFNRIDLRRAEAAGLTTRPLRETIAAVLDEGVPRADDKRRAGKLTREREARLLAEWSSAKAVSTR